LIDCPLKKNERKSLRADRQTNTQKLPLCGNTFFLNVQKKSKKKHTTQKEYENYPKKSLKFIFFKSKRTKKQFFLLLMRRNVLTANSEKYRKIAALRMNTFICKS